MRVRSRFLLVSHALYSFPPCVPYLSSSNLIILDNYLLSLCVCLECIPKTPVCMSPPGTSLLDNAVIKGGRCNLKGSTRSLYLIFSNQLREPNAQTHLNTCNNVALENVGSRIKTDISSTVKMILLFSCHKCWRGSF